MDSLVKDKLLIKPVVVPYSPVKVVLNEGRMDMPQLKGVSLRETEEEIEPVDIKLLKEKLREKKMLRVITKIQEEESELPVSRSEPIEPSKKRAKKITHKKIVMQDEDEDDDEDEDEDKLDVLEVDVDKIEKADKQTRMTPKVEKGVAELGPEEWVDIQGEKVSKRLPRQEPPIKIKLSSYYMNNRKIFVNFINSFFERYREELENLEKTISCDSLRGSEEFSLLTHQKVVKDYMNLYTPYRGLLLYHGLGSGKSCTSIAIAEGMKTNKHVIILTPKSLRDNYMEELKKCGDFMYKKKQYWEWVSNPDAYETLSSILGISIDYIKRRKGAWLVDVSKPPNTLTTNDMKSLDEQLNEMIQNKYQFIHYNGLRDRRLKQLTENFDKNLFDNSVVIIDEAHNFISRIVNKLKKEKPIPQNNKGEKDKFYKSISLKLYEYLLSAKNARIVFLTGTPIINYPNEIAVLFNILRGYIKTWEFPLTIKTNKEVSTKTLQRALQGEKVLDYIDYSPSSKKLIVTRNPLGFKNKIKEKSGYMGVSNQKKDQNENTIINTDYVSDDKFESSIIKILKTMDIEVNTSRIKIHNYTALPDQLDDFVLRFIDPITKKIKNIESFKKRIIGLTSYFRSAQEDLLPRYEKTPEYYHVVKIPMSNYQFKIYESARKTERQNESKRKAPQKFDQDGIYEEPTSTYRIFSRAFCNFVMPTPPGRPMPRDTKVVNNNAIDTDQILEQAQDIENNDENDDREGEIEGDEVINALGNSSYNERVQNALTFLKENSQEYLSKEGLNTYSPKFLTILDNIQDPDYPGLHLVYSQFRTLEGIGIFSMVLEANGFVRFRLKKTSTGLWEIDIKDSDLGKPTFALYTGTESDEEKKIILKIYNGLWDDIPTNIASQLQQISNNNNMGEIIKVFMITSSGSEGINLRNTRYVHIMEPYWHPVRSEQVIGRARRICSHKDLPEKLQSVNVFIYLMTFTKEQREDDDYNELRMKDKGKKDPSIPLTSDEALYEISTIKEEISSQLITGIKEASIDCALYSRNSNEGINCVSFGEPDHTSFSYNPDINMDQSDSMSISNKDKIQWTPVPITIRGIKYAGREIKKNMYNLYDYTSYERAKNVGGNPILIATFEIKPDGKKVFKYIV